MFVKDPTISLGDIKLRHMIADDYESLIEVALDSAIWTYFVTVVKDKDDLKGYIADILHQRERGTRHSFSIIENSSGQVVGSSAFGNYSSADQRIEIGWSWLASRRQGTGLNRKVKYLMMRHAFEDLGIERVEFKTDVLNLKARRALFKIGATEEGTLRSHTLMPTGRRRNTIYYSVLRPEWTVLKTSIFSDLEEEEGLAI